MNTTERILGLDIGDKRVGMAVSDEIGITAQPVGTLERSGSKADFERIIETAEEYGASEIVAGLPKRLNGSSSPQTEKVESFLAELRTRTDIPVKEWDERLTTVSAEASLIEANVRRKARRKVVDSVAAQIMLQHYLDCRGPRSRRDGGEQQNTESIER